MTTPHPVIALWAHPYALSTAFFRMMAERGDFWTIHKPFAGLAAQQHFDVAGKNVATAAELSAALLAQAEHTPVFWKDTTDHPHAHVLDHPGMLTEVQHVFLVRDPRAAIPSHYAINPAVTLDEIGYGHQHALFERVRAATGRAPLVIEAADLIDDAPSVIKRFCATTGIPYIPPAPAWQSGGTSQWHHPAHQHQHSTENHPTLAAYRQHHRPFYEQMRQAGAQESTRVLWVDTHTATRADRADKRRLPRAGRGETDEGSHAVVKRQYLEALQRNHCGISLERPPANWIVTPGPFPLEDVYEPPLLSTETSARLPGSQRESLGGVLRRFHHVTIVGEPGAGKTTLTKRIVAAYASNPPNINDDLPHQPYLPIVVQCRYLTDTTLPLTTLLQESVLQAVDGPAQNIESLIAGELEAGRLLLLVDGIDEIPDVKQRLSFMEKLRQCARRHPESQVILTADSSSLEQIRPGVAWTAITRIQTLSDSAVESLVRKWHHYVMGPSADTSLTAKRIAASILETPTLRALAATPLLLNLLLIVQRSAKSRTPDGRTALYTAAVRELLAMWNIGGNSRLRLATAQAQLAYVAYHMTAQGRSRVTDQELASLLGAARTAVFQLRNADRMSIEEFIDRIRRHTNLLRRIKTVTTDGHTVPGYEFSHLSLQRYLAACAIANVWVRSTRDRLHISDLWAAD